MSRLRSMVIGLALGGCTVGSAGSGGSPVVDTGCQSFVIDGTFSQDALCGAEWDDVTPLRGRFGDLYVGVDDDSNLIVLNDWHLRDDAPATADMYNLFCLATDVGVFELRVFGDQHVEAWRDGERIDQLVDAASGFGPSPLTPTPHTIFEFRLATLPTTMRVLECDPAGGTIEVPATPPDVVVAGTAGCFPGSAPDAPHNLVREPTLFEVELSADGVRAARISDAPLLLGTDAASIAPGSEITVYGAALGAAGAVWIDEQPADVIAWTEEHVVVRVPDGASDVVDVRVDVEGASSNTVRLRSRAPGCDPACGDGEVCDGGACVPTTLD